MPDDVAAEASRRLHAWAEERYGAALTTPAPLRSRFIVERARFPRQEH